MTSSSLTLAKSQVSHQLSRRLPYYLTPDEAHLLIDATDNERDLFSSGCCGRLDYGSVKPQRSS